MTYMNTQDGADHLDLLINNTQNYYNQKNMNFATLEKKVRNGTYDRTKAPKAFSYLTDVVRKAFNKEYAPQESDAISIASARQEDKDLVREFETDFLPNERKISLKGTAQTGRF